MDVARDLAWALDPVRFAEAAGVTLDPWQAEVLWSTASRILLNCSRQSGKSTVTGALAARTALYQPGSLVVLLSPSQRQSQELFRKVLTFYAVAAPGAPADVENRLTLELANGSRVVSLPGKESTIRGLSGVRLLVIDEAARVPEELYLAVRPMLAVSGGRLALLSTPYGTRGFFYEAWRDRQEHAWDAYEVPAAQCPRISAEFLEEERRAMGDFWFTQEYDCAFLDAQSASFREVDIENALTEDFDAWHL